MMRFLWSFLLSVAIFAGDVEDIRKCQQALLEGLVKRDTFSDTVLEQSIKTPISASGDKSKREALRKFFRQLGHESFQQRRAAKKALMSRFYDPAFLAELAAGTRDPEIRVTSRQVLAYWKKHPTKEDSERGKAERALKMWYNLPLCMAKRRTYGYVRGLAHKHKLDHQRLYDYTRQLPLNQLKPADRREWLQACFSAEKYEEELPWVEGLRQLTNEDWQDQKFLDALMTAIANEKSRVRADNVNSILKSMPKTVKLDEWVHLLEGADKRKAALAVVLARQGCKDAVPALLKLVTDVPKSLSIKNDQIDGWGGSSHYSWNSLLELIKNGEFRHLAGPILAATEKTIAKEVPAVQARFLRRVYRPLKDLPAGKEAILKQTQSACPQTAIWASCEMILTEGSRHSASLERAVLADTAFGVKNNLAELKGALRVIRRDAILNKDAQLKIRLVTIVEVMLKQAEKLALDYECKELFSYVSNEIVRFGIQPDVRRSVLAIVPKWKKDGDYWGFPDTAFNLLLEDARRRGDLDALVAELESKWQEGTTARERANYACLLLKAGAPPEKCVAPFRGKLFSMAKDKKAPGFLRDLAWMLDPVRTIKECHWDQVQYLFNEHTINRNCAWFDDASKVYLEKAPTALADIYRLSWELPGADLGKLSIGNKHQYHWSEVVGFLDCWGDQPAKQSVDEIERIFKELGDGNSYNDRLIKGMARPVVRHGLTEELSKRSHASLKALTMQCALIKGDRRIFEKLHLELQASNTPRFNEQLEKRTYFDVRDGNADDLAVAINRDKNYRLIQLLAENGHFEKAVSIQQRWNKDDPFYAWETSYARLLWAWNALRVENYELASKLVLDSMAHTAELCQFEYAEMMLTHIRARSPELTRYASILKLRATNEKKLTASLVDFADSTTNSDLQALAAYQAARRLKDSDPTNSRRLLTLGRESEGYHAKYCAAALKATAKPQFAITENWHTRRPLPRIFNPFSHSIGVSLNTTKQSLFTKEITWVDPYGIPNTSSNPNHRFAQGSGWWLYLQEYTRNWVHGEWSIIIDHEDGIEHHQRRLRRW